jgi:hypothetical protein
MSDKILENNAHKFVVMPPAQGFFEHATYPLDHPAFACSWTSMTKSQQRAFCDSPFTMLFWQMNSFFFGLKLQQRTITDNSQ